MTDLPKIGESLACDLRLIGINHPEDLIGKNPITLYETLCFKTGNRHDPCVIDVFLSVVHFIEGGKTRR
ncbi:MAG: helix-hairpin-helix domain-containing protein [Smithella sp.]